MKEIPEPIDFGDDIPTEEDEAPIHFPGFEIVPIENRIINEGDVLVRLHPVGREFTYLKKYITSSSGRIGIFDDFGDFSSIDMLMPKRWGVLVEHDFGGQTVAQVRVNNTIMSPDEYVGLAMRTASDKYLNDPQAHMNGLVLESAEYMDLLHKMIFHGKGIKLDDLKSELGDIAWMLACACHFHRIKLSDVMQGNLDKLQKRHGNKYNADHYKSLDGSE